MKVGLMGFGKTGKAVASVLLESNEANLQWVIRKTKLLEHRSLPAFLGVLSDDPGLIYSKNEFTAASLLDCFPVGVIIDFSSRHGIDYYGEEASLAFRTRQSVLSMNPFRRNGTSAGPGRV